jgi:hypothetical protein
VEDAFFTAVLAEAISGVVAACWARETVALHKARPTINKYFIVVV